MHKIISIQTAQGLLHKQLFHCINLSKNTRKLKSGVDGGVTLKFGTISTEI